MLRGGRHGGQLLQAAKAAEALDAALMQEGALRHVLLIAAHHRAALCLYKVVCQSVVLKFQQTLLCGTIMLSSIWQHPAPYLAGTRHLYLLGLSQAAAFGDHT